MVVWYKSYDLHYSEQIAQSRKGLICRLPVPSLGLSVINISIHLNKIDIHLKWTETHSNPALTMVLVQGKFLHFGSDGLC